MKPKALEPTPAVAWNFATRLNGITRILLAPLIPDRYVRIFCLVAGLVMVCAGLVLIFGGYHGLLFVLIGFASIGSAFRPKAPEIS